MARRRTGGPNGFAVIDKPRGWTSHDVVAKARGVFGTGKVGHSGTLDPDATGVLILGVGKGTRLLRFLDGAVKSYTGEIVFGVETNSLDSTGEVSATHDMDPIDLDAARAVVAASLMGPIDQIPPMVSAKKVDGKRLHQLAREGIEIDRKPARVRIDAFDLAATDDPMRLAASVACSSGTYIRVLAADLGRLMGGGAHLHGLRRTAIGSFGDDSAEPLEEATIRPISGLLCDLSSVTVDASTAIDVSFGKVLGRKALGVSGDGPYPVLDGSGELLAVYESHRGDTVKPAVVVTEPIRPTEAQP